MEAGTSAAWPIPTPSALGAYFYLYYLGQDRARPTRQRIGVARSADGLHWEKLRSNPVLELDGERGLGEPAVWTSHGFYWMLYTARDFAENRRLGMARSTDGVHWRKLPADVRRVRRVGFQSALRCHGAGGGW